MNLKNIKIIFIFLLLVLSFDFFHSEIIDHSEAKNECQKMHDYCKLVQTASVKNSSSDLLKLNVEKSICFHCINKASEHNSSYNKLNFEQFYTSQKTTDIYLHNRVFLI